MPTFAGHIHPYHTMSRAAVPPRSPPSPSDTGYDLGVNSATARQLSTGAERPSCQPRRTSALSYQNSGPRDFHHRSYSRNLVVVIPPPDLPLDHGHLGNVLSVGPRHRLSQGSLMPLFPSMFAQLNAIAREYNFPSTVGLCLYLHINENGIAMTPRISDDSWQYLFGHLFDGRSSPGTRDLPIGGSIEFDIDLNKARWFDAWVSGTSRESGPAFQPFGTSSEAHWRGESQGMDVEEQPAGHRRNPSGSHTVVTSSRPETLRHVPKKLSLVERLEAVRLSPKSKDCPDFANRGSSPTHGTYASSPILRPAIPQATESNLEHRVNSWRATTELCPASMAETYQSVPDVAASVPATAMDDYALAHNFRQAVRIDEFLCSATSAGPHSPTKESLIASPRPSSVHLDRRVNGSVLPTPTTMTSWGPADDERRSVVSSVARLPSPDVGERTVEDIMSSRSHAVWGNSFGWRSAMTWKQVYPYALTQTKPVIRVLLQDSDDLAPQYPNLVIYPSVESRADTHVPERPKSSSPSVWGNSFGWQRTVPWRKAYPYLIPSVDSVRLRGAGGLGSRYPRLCIYPAAYPYFEVYPTCAVEEDILQPVSILLNESSSSLACYPSLVIYPAVYPHFNLYPLVEEVKTKELSHFDASTHPLGDVSTPYPNLVIYPPVYPHFDLYPKALQINETAEQNEVHVRLANVGCLTAEYPNMTIYPGSYPYLEIYPTLRMGRSSSVSWGFSFGWLTAKTWLRVYPLHTAGPLAAKQRADDQNGTISKPAGRGAGTGKRQAVWGSSFGWMGATTWRAVWPNVEIQSYSNEVTSVHLRQQGDSPNYPYLVIYPSVYPHLEVYPPPPAVVKVEESHDQLAVSTAHYPNLVIYPAEYPHFDLYPAFSRASDAIERGKGETNLRCRRIEMWRARTAAQVGLSELLADNHIWEAEEPLRLDLADYAWSQTSAGPGVSPLEPIDTPSILGSVHIDRRIQGSVVCTPSTATTWGPQDDDWHSEIESIERLPSPDLGQRVLDDVENIEFPYQPWHTVWPFFANQDETILPDVERSVFVPEYPHLVIYPPACSYFEPYLIRMNGPTFEEMTEIFANSNVYPVLDIYPAVYPHIDIYPAIYSQIDIPCKTALNNRSEQVEVRLPSVYPNFDIYRACYPYDLNYIYPVVNATESAQISIEASSCYPWLVVYPSVYPFITPYPYFSDEIDQLSPQERSPIYSSTESGSVSVKLPVRYPLLELYPASYPWSLEPIYPAVPMNDSPATVELQYPCVRIYPPVYPFVQPYPSDSVHFPGTLDEGEYESTRASLALSELQAKPIDLGSIVHPYFDHPARLVLQSQQERAVQDAYLGDLTTPAPRTRMQRKTHKELHALAFRSLGKQRARIPKTHLQLHTEVFQDGVVRTPSGHTQDLSSLKAGHDVPVRELRPPRDDSTLGRSRSRSGSLTTRSPDKFTFPLGRPPPLPLLSPLRPRTPSQPSPAVSETPAPRVSPTDTRARTKSTRLSQAVKAMMPKGHKRNASASSADLPRSDHSERTKPPTKFLSLVDRPTVAPTNRPDFLTRPVRNSTTSWKDGLVLQRARAYEQAAAVGRSVVDNHPSTKDTRSPFILPPLPSVIGTGEVIEISKA